MKVYEVKSFETARGSVAYDMHFPEKRRAPLFSLTIKDKIYKTAVEWGNLEVDVIRGGKHELAFYLIAKQLEFQALMHLAASTDPSLKQVRLVRNQTIGSDLCELFKMRATVIELRDIRRW